MTQPTGQLWMALLTCLWLHGCLSAGVMQLATGPRYRFARMTEVTEAALVGTDVFVRIGVLRPDRTEPEDDDLSLFADYRQGVPPPGDPLLVIVLPSLEGKTRSIFISDVQDGHTTRRPWLFLMPLAAAADVVLLPFEFGVALVEME